MHWLFTMLYWYVLRLTSYVLRVCLKCSRTLRIANESLHVFRLTVRQSRVNNFRCRCVRVRTVSRKNLTKRKLGHGNHTRKNFIGLTWHIHFWYQWWKVCLSSSHKKGHKRQYHRYTKLFPTNLKSVKQIRKFRPVYELKFLYYAKNN